MGPFLSLFKTNSSNTAEPMEIEEQPGVAREPLPEDPASQDQVVNYEQPEAMLDDQEQQEQVVNYEQPEAILDDQARHEQVLNYEQPEAMLGDQEQQEQVVNYEQPEAMLDDQEQQEQVVNYEQLEAVADDQEQQEQVVDDPSTSSVAMPRPARKGQRNLTSFSIQGIRSINNRSGSSIVAILKFLNENGYTVNNERRVRQQVLKGLKTAVSQGVLVQNKRSFKLSPKQKAKERRIKVKQLAKIQEKQNRKSAARPKPR